jgi:hypothetical protein
MQDIDNPLASRESFGCCRRTSSTAGKIFSDCVPRLSCVQKWWCWDVIVSFSRKSQSPRGAPSALLVDMRRLLSGERLDISESRETIIRGGRSSVETSHERRIMPVAFGSIPGTCKGIGAISDFRPEISYQGGIDNICRFRRGLHILSN